MPLRQFCNDGMPQLSPCKGRRAAGYQGGNADRKYLSEQSHYRPQLRKCGHSFADPANSTGGSTIRNRHLMARLLVVQVQLGAERKHYGVGRVPPA